VDGCDHGKEGTCGAKIEELQADLIVALEQEQFVLRDEDVERLALAMNPKPRTTK
jgi:hypothetical protein